MLVLSRKRDQQIVVGDNVVITIVEIRGDKVRLGIEAPPHVPVHRSEVFDAIARSTAGDLSLAGNGAARNDESATRDEKPATK